MLNEVSRSCSQGVLYEYFMHASSPVLLLDRQGSVVLCNAVAAMSLSVAAGEPADELWSKIGLSADQAADIEARLAELFDRGGRITGELLLSTGRQIEYTFLLLDDNGAGHELASLTIADITEQTMGRGLSEVLNRIHQDLGTTDEPERKCTAVLERVRGAAGADSVAILRRRDGRWTTRWHAGKPVERPGGPFGDDEVLKDFPRLAARQVSLLEHRPGLEGEIGTRLPRPGGLVLAAPLTIGQELVGAMLVSLQQRRFVHPIQMDFFYKVGAAISSSLERQGLLDEIEERAEVLHQVIERYPGTIALLHHPSMDLEFANQNFTDLISSKIDLEALPPPTMEKINAIIGAAVSTQTVQSGEEFQLRLNDKTRTWSYSVVPMGQGGKVLLFTFDVTEQVDQRHRFEELARREESGRQRLEAILKTIPVGILVVDENGRVDMTNDMRAEIWGGQAPVTDMGGMSGLNGFWSETGLPVTAKEWPLYRAWKEGLITLGAMIDIKRADGSMGTILGSAAPVRDQGGQIIGAVGILQDISRQRRLEQDAIEAKLKMELYLDVLAHDVNNLNAAAGGYLQLYLDKEKTTAAGRRYLENIGAMLGDISSLIGSINKLQTLELSGGTRSLTDLAVVLDESVISMEKTSGRDVRIEYRPVLKTLVMGNELLKDLFDNLIGNAVKHCPEPVRIKIIVGKMLIEAREFYRVEVEDNGPGIPDVMKVKLFNRFQRGSSKAHGRGLGLYLVKNIAEEFGGKVWVEDRVEGDWTMGARFVVCLPVAQVPRSDLSSQP